MQDFFRLACILQAVCKNSKRETHQKRNINASRKKYKCINKKIKKRNKERQEGKEGRKEGRKEARTEGRKEGRKQGSKEGWMEGRKAAGQEGRFAFGGSWVLVAFAFGFRWLL